MTGRHTYKLTHIHTHLLLLMLPRKKKLVLTHFYSTKLMARISFESNKSTRKWNLLLIDSFNHAIREKPAENNGTRRNAYIYFTQLIASPKSRRDLNRILRQYVLSSFDCFSIFLSPSFSSLQRNIADLKTPKYCGGTQVFGGSLNAGKMNLNERRTMKINDGLNMLDVSIRR